MHPGGYLTKQASGATAPVAARSWLAKHKVIFRLDSVRGLRLAADSRMTGGRGHAVTFQQSFEGLKVLNGAGLITVSMVPGKQLHRWKIGFASSTAAWLAAHGRCRQADARRRPSCTRPGTSG